MLLVACRARDARPAVVVVVTITSAFMCTRSAAMLKNWSGFPTACSRAQKIENTVRYLGVEVDDALEIAEKIDV